MRSPLRAESLAFSIFELKIPVFRGARNKEIRKFHEYETGMM
jgi:hypothetical protein